MRLRLIGACLGILLLAAGLGVVLFFPKPSPGQRVAETETARIMEAFNGLMGQSVESRMAAGRRVSGFAVTISEPLAAELAHFAESPQGKSVCVGSNSGNPVYHIELFTSDSPQRMLLRVHLDDDGLLVIDRHWLQDRRLVGDHPPSISQGRAASDPSVSAF